MAYKSLEITDYELVAPYLKENKTRNSLFTIGTLFAWTPYFHFEFNIIFESLVFKGQLDSYPPTYLYPLGPHASEIIKGVNSLLLVPEGFEMPQGFEAEPIPHFFDYLYSYDNLIKLEGKKYQKIRNHINLFLRLYPSYEIRPYNNSYRQAVSNLIEKEKKEFESSKFEAEAANFLVTHCQELHQEISLLLVNNVLVGMTIYEIVGDTIFLHVEKNDKDYEGSGDMNRISFLRSLNNKNIKFVNREEDIGDPGLAFSKRSLNPQKLLQKYYLKRVN